MAVEEVEKAAQADAGGDPSNLANLADPAGESSPTGESADYTFAHMNLADEVSGALADMGFTVPMEVQRQVFEPAMAGRDLMVQARTGSGKTAAFGIPFAQGLVTPGQKGVQAIVLCPTRELALQVANELARIKARLDIGTVAVYGGAPMGKQIEALKAGAQVVVGTPGRVLDHIRRGTLKLDGCKIAVLDECDEMLSMGFLEDIEKILSELPPPGQRQTLLFSATIPPDIERIGSRYMRDPLRIAMADKVLAPREISHAYYMVTGGARMKDLLRVLAVEKPESAIIFCNTRDETASVANFLQKQGLDAEAISSDLSQSDRERVMKRSKDKTLKYLVATDIAARGIDISDLTHVINYTFPESAEVYIHRTGRTGRAGKTGAAVSLIGPRELGNFYYLKLITKVKPEERMLPSDDELSTRREADRFSKLLASVSEEAGDEWRALARRLATSADGERVVAALIKRTLAPAGEPTAAGEPAKVSTIAKPAAAREDKKPKSAPAPQPDLMARLPRKVNVVDLPTAQAMVQSATPVAETAAAAEAEPAQAEPAAGAVAGAERDGSASGTEGGDRERTSRRRARPEGERFGERPRGERAGRGERERGRGRFGERRDRGERGGERRPETAAERAARRQPEPVRPLERPLNDHREFWEAWVDEKTTVRDTAPPVPAVDNEFIESTPTTAMPAPRPERPERPERGERGERAAGPAGTVRLYLNLGRRDGASDVEIEELILERTGLSEDDVAKLEVRDTHTYLHVRPELEPAIVTALSGFAYGARTLLCERARK